MSKIKSSLHKVNQDIGYKATRQGDAIRVDMYLGRRKVKNFCYFFQVPNWPESDYNKWHMVYNTEPTLLKGPALNNNSMGNTNADAIVKAVEEIV